MNTFGTLLRLTTFGESHGKAMGGILDGFPPGFMLDFEKAYSFIARRRPGTDVAVTARKESDIPVFLSGILPDGTTLGTPIGFYVPNSDTRSGDYDDNAEKFRPSHADFTYFTKYGVRDHRGGGRASARETVSWVVAGALVMQWLESLGIRIHACLTAAGDVEIENPFRFLLTADGEPRLYEPEEKIIEIKEHIKATKANGDSIGGKVSCLITGVPAGIGDPVAGKLHARLAAAMMTINAAKGFEYGAGMDACCMKGSEAADIFLRNEGGNAVTQTNYSGGIQGGISNGMPIYFNVAFKPTPTVMRNFPTIDSKGKETVISEKGRHDPCVALRAVPIVESMAALSIADAILLNRTISFR